MSEKSPERKIWFPAKRYGWGWGAPVRWQGWVLFGLFFYFVLTGIGLADHECAHHPDQPVEVVAEIVAYEMTLVAVPVIICLIKGEKPAWR